MMFMYTLCVSPCACVCLCLCVRKTDRHTDRHTLCIPKARMRNMEREREKGEGGREDRNEKDMVAR